MLLLSAVLVTALLSVCRADEHEYRLYEDLMRFYNPLERPVENNSFPVKVTIGLVLQQIVDMDEKNQMIQINAWVKYTWHDYKLRWEPGEYGGVGDLRFPSGKIWHPDVLVYNSADSAFDSTYHCNHVVYADGTVLWVPPGIFRMNCNIDIKWFPFDDQSCFIKFGSWTYHGYALDLQPEDPANGVDVSEYLPNGEWLLMSSPVDRNEKFYECCPEPYVDVKFYLHLRRRTLYYWFNLVLPSMLISLMTLLGFTLPPEAGEKITLEITILLSVYIYMSMVAGMTPQTDTVPLLGVFFTTCMTVVAASVVFTVVVLNLHYRTPDTHVMNPFVKTVLLNWLPWILMMNRPGQKFNRPTISDLLPSGRKKRIILRNAKLLESGIGGSGGSQDSATPLGEQTVKANRDRFGRRLTMSVANHRKESMTLESKMARLVEPVLASPGAVDPGVQALILMLQRIHSELAFVVRRMEKDDVDSDHISDWKFAAMAVDRLCLIVFSVFIVGTSLGILLSAPHLFT
uniref:Uncharacterized protein n=1 Tax=Plectus sambesii TaxID=2011161 RepID=A0A914WRM2_9BILA